MGVRAAFSVTRMSHLQLRLVQGHCPVGPPHQQQVPPPPPVLLQRPQRLDRPRGSDSWRRLGVICGRPLLLLHPTGSVYPSAPRSVYLSAPLSHPQAAPPAAAPHRIRIPVSASIRIPVSASIRTPVSPSESANLWSLRNRCSLARRSQLLHVTITPGREALTSASGGVTGRSGAGPTAAASAGNPASHGPNTSSVRSAARWRMASRHACNSKPRGVVASASGTPSRCVRRGAREASGYLSRNLV
eukprot:8551243-Pyramimonas_sp.AAC.1